jgi:hypothetical protein
METESPSPMIEDNPELQGYSYLEDIDDLTPFDWIVNENDNSVIDEKKDKTDSDNSNDDDDTSVISSNFTRKFYRKITNFKITDIFGAYLKSFFTSEADPCQFFLIIGELLPVESGDTLFKEPEINGPVKVKIPLVDMYYNFGLPGELRGENMENNILKENHLLEEGYWIKDYEGMLYQLIPPCHNDYLTFYQYCVDIASFSFFPSQEGHFNQMFIHRLFDFEIMNKESSYIDPVAYLSDDNNRENLPIIAFGKLREFFPTAAVTDDLEALKEDFSKKYLKVQIHFIKCEISYGIHANEGSSSLNDNVEVDDVSKGKKRKKKVAEKQENAMKKEDFRKSDLRQGIFLLPLNDSVLSFHLENPSDKYLSSEQFIDYSLSCLNHELFFKYSRTCPFYSFPFIKLTDFIIVDYNGTIINTIFPSLSSSSTSPNNLDENKKKSAKRSIEPTTEKSQENDNFEFLDNDPYQSYYCLSGRLYHKKINNESIFIRCFIQDYCFDLGYQQNSQEVSVFTFCTSQQLYYRLVWSAVSEFLPFHYILNDYNWPCEEGTSEVWRRITNYSLTDKERNYQSLLVKSPNMFILKGDLLPPPVNGSIVTIGKGRKTKKAEISIDSVIPSDIPSLHVQVYVNGYSIDFGRTQYDDARGLWLCDIYMNWIKLVTPCFSGYDEYSTSAMLFTEKFLTFHDTLRYYEYEKDSFFCQNNEDIFICNFTIKEIYEKSSGNFDISFINSNKSFIKDNIKIIINEEKSIRFYKSLKSLRGICDFLLFVCCFLYFCSFVVFLFVVAGSIKDIVKEDDKKMPVVIEDVEDKSPVKLKQQSSSAASSEKRKGKGRPSKRKIAELEEPELLFEPEDDGDLWTIPKEEVEVIVEEEPAVVKEETEVVEEEVPVVPSEHNLNEVKEAKCTNDLSVVPAPLAEAHGTLFESTVEQPTPLPDPQQDPVAVEDVCNLSKPIKRKSFDEEERIPIKRKMMTNEAAEMYCNHYNKVRYSDEKNTEAMITSPVSSSPVSSASISVVSPDNDNIKPDKNRKQNGDGTLCRYCHTLRKNPKCYHSIHKDGFLIPPLSKNNNNPYRSYQYHNDKRGYNDHPLQDTVPLPPPPPPIHVVSPKSASSSAVAPLNQHKANNNNHLCPTCKTHRKTCDDPKHVEGFPYPFFLPKKPSAIVNTSNVAFINNSISTNVGGYGAVSVPKNMSSSSDDNMNEALISKVQQNEEKAKERYLKHHDHTIDESAALSLDSLVNQAFSVYHAKHTTSLTSFSSVSSSSSTSKNKISEKFKNALIMNIPKHEPLGKEVKPIKSAMKSISKDFSQILFAFEANPNLLRTKKLSFSDEKNDTSNNNRRILEEAVIYPAEEDDSPLSVHST